MEEIQITSLAPTRARSGTPAKYKAASHWNEGEDTLLTSLCKGQTNLDWDTIKDEFRGKSLQQIQDRWMKVLNPDLIKGSWNLEEDLQIVQWVMEHGAKDWSSLAQSLPGRLGKQCRERWINSLDPDLSRKAWTQEEDDLLIEKQKEWGNKWAKIAQLLPGRTDNSVKNRWNSSLKRKMDRVAAGLEPVMKRGRKPKRPSCAPNIALDTQTPKPDVASMELSIAAAVDEAASHDPTDVFSPLSSDKLNSSLCSPIMSKESPFPLGNLSPLMSRSPFNFALSPAIRSPGFSLNSPMISLNLDGPDASDISSRQHE